jgi:NADH-quinone oxidoreductase subunit E
MSDKTNTNLNGPANTSLSSSGNTSPGGSANSNRSGPANSNRSGPANTSLSSSDNTNPGGSSANSNLSAPANTTLSGPSNTSPSGPANSNPSGPTNTVLSEKVRTDIDRWIVRYPADQKRSGVMQALSFAQEENKGYLTIGIMDAVADYLGMPRIAVYEVVSFYTMYHTKPVGKYILNICTNISCMLCDCEKIVQHLKKRLQIDFNETTPDKKFTLREVECLGACANAPVIHVGNQYYENLTPEKVDAMLDELE